MRHLQRAVALSAMAVSIVCCRSSEGRATLSSSPLAPERVQVYRDFLSEFAGTHFSYLSDTTFALTLSEVGPGSTCLKGIDLGDISGTLKTVHSLTPEIARGKTFRLVAAAERAEIVRMKDAASAAQRNAPKENSANAAVDPGILSLSEIAFDKEHHFAVIQYVFTCGSNCNSGSTLILEKVGSRWTAKSRRPCAAFANDIHFRVP